MKKLLSWFTPVALLAYAGAALAAPTVDKGDTTWMMTATALVILMTIPGLALFYGGMVRAKNTLSVLMQVFVTFSRDLGAVGGLRLQRSRSRGATPSSAGSRRCSCRG
jgi:hypothetical protein